MIAAPIRETSESLPRGKLTLAQQDEMYALLTQYFDGVTRDQFDHDLTEKNWVIHLRREGRLVGFSTLLACESVFDAAVFTAIYSGDTIVAPEAWGTPALARTWIATVNRLRAEYPERKCYWLLLTSGFRTYRFLPVFWREFYPRFDAETPLSHNRLMRHLAHERYGRNYDESAGIVRFPQPQRLHGALAEIPAGRQMDPHVAFFFARNPGHTRGDELVCLTEISDQNLTPAGRRMLT
ncbi:MAG TPA: hypothetical protein VNV14_00800 [Opitutaceae bacterium]|jgi:hypothetical protein|nr:hypothetical protein [Opitutaceae bacterium]